MTVDGIDIKIYFSCPGGVSFKWQVINSPGNEKFDVLNNCIAYCTSLFKMGTVDLQSDSKTEDAVAIDLVQKFESEELAFIVPI